MPILNVKVGAKKTPGMTGKIGSMLLELTTRILGKNPNLTAIAIDYVDPDDWIVGGRTLSEQNRSSIYFDIKITDETNSKDEKAHFIAEAFDAFENLLGNLHEESYIYVQDVRAASYGYGGRTQEYRYHHK
jgi:4-oxalocrotonate tautomerase